MVLSGSTSCYNYWQNIGKNYGNTHNSEFYVPCILKSQVKPNTNTGDLKVKACLFEQSSKKKTKKKQLLTLASIPKLRKNAAKVYYIKDSDI